MIVREFSRVRACAASAAARRCAVWLALAACLVLFVRLRVSGIGHVLMWDEAWDVCAAQSLASGEGDVFTKRMWMHPPALPSLSLLMQPLVPGFAERYEMLVLAINACAMVVLFLLNRRIFGSATALWSCFFLAVMPGAIFFDVWIKGGCIVSLATLGAVAALAGGKPLFSGLCLGLALLDKETAVLPCVAVCMIALADARHRNLKCVTALTVTALLVSGWWYVFLSTTTTHWPKFATGAAWDASCDLQWYSYLRWLHVDIGAAGFVLLVAGLAWLTRRGGAATTDSATRSYSWWPVLVGAVTYGGFTLCRNKSPWFTMFAYPALATIQALGMAGFLGMCSTRFPRLRPLWLLGAGAFACLMYFCATGRPFATAQRIVMGAELHNAVRTRALAEAVNMRIASGERLLATTFSYHERPMPSPIFDHYLTNVPMLVVSHLTPFSLCADTIMTDRLDWALLIPVPGTAATAITNGFKSRFNLDPTILDNGTAFLYRTTSAYARDRRDGATE